MPHMIQALAASGCRRRGALAAVAAEQLREPGRLRRDAVLPCDRGCTGAAHLIQLFHRRGQPVTHR